MLNKDKIKDVIRYFQDYAAEVEVLPRPVFLEEHGNYVFVGLRRVGKTYMLFQQIQHLILGGVPRQQMAIQACYSLSDTDTRKREVNALLQISKHWQITKHLIITKDEEETITEDAIQIEVVPVWKWLLNI